MIDVILIGAGGHGKVVLDTIFSNKDSEINIIGFLDDGKIEEIYGIKKLGEIKDYINFKDKKFHIALGNNKLRKELSEKIEKENLITVIHKTAYVSEKANIKNGTYIGAMAVINTECEIGYSCIINTGTIVEHETKIEDYSHLSYRVLIGSNSRIEKLQTIEMGKILERNSVIGSEKCHI